MKRSGWIEFNVMAILTRKILAPFPPAAFNL